MEISKQLEQLIQKVPCSIYWKDLNGVYLGCNEFMAKTAGASSKEVVGKTDYDLPWHADAKKLRKIDAEVVKTGKAITTEESGIHANGKRGVYLTVKMPLIDDKTKNMVGIFGVSMDITSHKRTEKKLQDEKRKILHADHAQLKKLMEISQEITGQVLSENATREEYALHMLDYLESIIGCMPGSVYWKDANGIYRGGNDYLKKLAGFQSKKEIIGKTDYDFAKIFGWNKQTAENIINLNMEVMKSGVARYNIEEEPFRNAEGKYIYQLSNKVPLFNPSGKVIGLVGISIDITERKRMEEALRLSKEAAEAANKTKTEFLENMRHDIRTPLSGIIGCATAIKESLKSQQPDEINEYVDNLIVSSHALLNFLNEILEVIKVASGEIPLLKKKFDLKEKLLNIICLNQSKVSQKKLKLTLEYDESIPHYLIGDPTRIHRIVLELVTNALNFTERGYVKIITHLARDCKRDVVIKIIVKDTGTGISPDKQQEVFTRFKRLTPSYEGVYKGAGLGLAIIKQFIDDLDGEIYVESEPNKGSIFTCIIPLRVALLSDEFGVDHSVASAKPEISLPETNFPVATQEKLTKRIRILIVEDQIIATKIANSILKELGCLVDVAVDGKSAISLVDSNYYDLIFMDVGLPDMSGNEVTKHIREWGSFNNDKHTPIIALTAHIDVENKEECIKAGMNAVLSKPFSREIAISILNAFIPQRITEQLEESLEEGKELFKLPDAMLDFNDAVEIAGGDEDIAKELITMLINSLSQELEDLQIAFKQQNWKQIQSIAHKLKGGACYCGLQRLRIACSNLESCLTGSKTELRIKLYEQFLQEIIALQNLSSIGFDLTGCNAPLKSEEGSHPARPVATA